MITAGTLKYKLIFKQIVNTQSETGAINKSKVELLTCRAAKIKNHSKYGSGINAKELFTASALEFKMRFNKLITTDLIVEFNNVEYSILSVDEDKYDNSTTIIIDKINN